MRFTTHEVQVWCESDDASEICDLSTWVDVNPSVSSPLALTLDVAPHPSLRIQDTKLIGTIQDESCSVTVISKTEPSQTLRVNVRRAPYCEIERPSAHVPPARRGTTVRVANIPPSVERARREGPFAIQSLRRRLSETRRTGAPTTSPSVLCPVAESEQRLDTRSLDASFADLVRRTSRFRWVHDEDEDDATLIEIRWDEASETFDMLVLAAGDDSLLYVFDEDGDMVVYRERVAGYPSDYRVDKTVEWSSPAPIASIILGEDLGVIPDDGADLIRSEDLFILRPRVASTTVRATWSQVPADSVFPATDAILLDGGIVRLEPTATQPSTHTRIVQLRETRRVSCETSGRPTLVPRGSVVETEIPPSPTRYRFTTLFPRPCAMPDPALGYVFLLPDAWLLGGGLETTLRDPWMELAHRDRGSTLRSVFGCDDIAWEDDRGLFSVEPSEHLPPRPLGPLIVCRRVVDETDHSVRYEDGALWMVQIEQKGAAWATRVSTNLIGAPDGCRYGAAWEAPPTIDRDVIISSPGATWRVQASAHPTYAIHTSRAPVTLRMATSCTLWKEAGSEVQTPGILRCEKPGFAGFVDDPRVFGSSEGTRVPILIPSLSTMIRTIPTPASSTSSAGSSPFLSGKTKASVETASDRVLIPTFSLTLGHDAPSHTRLVRHGAAVTLVEGPWDVMEKESCTIHRTEDGMVLRVKFDHETEGQRPGHARVRHRQRGTTIHLVDSNQ